MQTLLKICDLQKKFSELEEEIEEIVEFIKTSDEAGNSMQGKRKATLIFAKERR